MSANETEKRALLRKAETVLIKTGNTVKRSIFGQTLIEELELSLCCTLESWIKSEVTHKIPLTKDVVCSINEFMEPLNKDERNEYKVTVKIFMGSRDGDDIDDSVNKAMEEMGVSSVECVILSLVPDSNETESFLDQLKPLWSALESLVKKGLVYTLGISDLNKEQLEKFYEWAEVKPCINQVNLDSCCVIPVDMVEYAKLRDIQLFTHSDPSDILPSFTELMKTKITEPNFPPPVGLDWQPTWVAKYSALIKCRGIIHSKGYVVKAKRVK